MKLAITLFAFLTAVAGWFYMFYSQAARRLAAVEGDVTNRRRIRLRQVSGFAMLLLSVLFFAGFYTVDPDETPRAYVLVWIGVMLTLLLIVILALFDLRLTMRLRRTPEVRKENHS